ncbi:phospholipid/cholesterol/gamma-HCH transport system substrate-binding protein [Natronocella acetinitrilica]|uniref:Phospholipid/cholesterol/gamma-HCH transport system substrate-binding protein n=1 Tax=Natronocella acetinitrilica TaxID=414046 RepID=A0AAE3G6X9_9GAMM|nr:MlaD family protein [Natronocella acetinitrilica]MCP1675523.1 phospholipid/cholesterol/gamma-HCH transport system substrate-binding protein [Natronocella acetinitrilica]
METKVSYTLVGLFVLVLGATLAAGAIWLTADFTTYDYETYSVYSRESVSGLNRNSPVTYRGVTVGRIRDVRLYDDDPEQVHILVDIRPGTPLREDTLAQITSQGLTGISLMELTGGTVDAAPPPQPDGEPYPVIGTAPSLISRLDDALTQGLRTLESIEESIRAVLSEDNLTAFGNILGNVDELTTELTTTTRRLDGVLEGANKLLDDTGELGTRLPETLARVDDTLLSFQTLAQDLGVAGNEVAIASREGARSLDELGRATLPQLNELMREIEDLTSGMSRLANELAENPNLLIFGRPRREPGPGEE